MTMADFAYFHLELDAAIEFLPEHVFRAIGILNGSRQ